MQLMPETAVRMGVTDRCDVKQNISGGIRYLANLLHKFNGDLRLVAAAYYAGEGVIERRRLSYSNPDVVTYVKSLRRLSLKMSEGNRCSIAKEGQCN
jgi:soluble lytic murein transglycosylase-like protein